MVRLASSCQHSFSLLAAARAGRKVSDEFAVPFCLPLNTTVTTTIARNGRMSNHAPPITVCL
jgi:hypothetical protein